jgi:hypothetical protein
MTDELLTLWVTGFSRYYSSEAKAVSVALKVFLRFERK